jgi:trehalose 6-phosphate synthase
VDIAKTHEQELNDLVNRIVGEAPIVIASNRGPIRFQNENLKPVVGSGGLVTAIRGISRHTELTWISSCMSKGDRKKARKEKNASFLVKNKGRKKPEDNFPETFRLRLLSFDKDMYNDYYNKISNQILWLYQHYLFDITRTPVFTSETWDAWDNYKKVNKLFAQAILNEVKESRKRTKLSKHLVMIQDYHLYLVAKYIRKLSNGAPDLILQQFIHIPWPGGPQYWHMMPAQIRNEILEGLVSNDIVGFQTQQFATNFIRTCQVYLKHSEVVKNEMSIDLNHRSTYIKQYPIGIDCEELLRLYSNKEVVRNTNNLLEYKGKSKIIVMIQRAEPSKNVLRGLKAFSALLSKYPNCRKKIKILIHLIPSRLKNPEYQKYLEEIMAKAGWINAQYSTSDWEPVRIYIGDNYPRALACLRIYDVLLCNVISDGMNLVAKEGPILNDFTGVVVLSETAGSHEQLENGVITISPFDIYGTSEAIYKALNMNEVEREKRQIKLKQNILEEDLIDWFKRQLEDIERVL